jgi:heme-degrading monooxygenase HmoA
MFIAMNRFKVKIGSEHDFEQIWLNRETHLGEMPGFIEFHLLKGPEREDHVLYSRRRVALTPLDAWTKSDSSEVAPAPAPTNAFCQAGVRGLHRLREGAPRLVAASSARRHG